MDTNHNDDLQDVSSSDVQSHREGVNCESQGNHKGQEAEKEDKKPKISLFDRVKEGIKNRFSKFLPHKFPEILGQSKEVECISLELIKEYFLEPERRDFLSDNTDVLPVAIKEKISEEKIGVTVALYDDQREEFLSQIEPIKYVAPKLDARLEEVFGDKEMIILR